MLRNRSIYLVLALMIVSARARAQDWREDDSIWSFGHIGGPHREHPLPEVSPIVPPNWISVSSTSEDPALLAFPWILDPTRESPHLGESGWAASLAPPLASAACAFTIVESDVDEVRMARLSAARWLVVNGSVFIGDPDRRGDRGVPIALQKGRNRLFAVDASADWELELWKPSTRCVIGTWDVGWPDITGQDKAFGDLYFPVFNASVRPVSGLHVHYGHFFVPTDACRPMLTDWREVGCVAPLSMALGRIYYEGISDECGSTPGRAGNVGPVCVYDGGDDEAARELLCDRDASYDRRRLSPDQREIGRESLGGRPQANIADDSALIYGTLGSAEETAALLARARLDQQTLWYACGAAPFVMSDVEFLGEDAGEDAKIRFRSLLGSNGEPLVLYGSESTNQVWKWFATNDESMRVPSERLPAPDDNGIRPSFALTLAWSRIVRRGVPYPMHASVGFASEGISGARLSLALGMLAARDGTLAVDAGSPQGFVEMAVAPK